MVVMLELPKPFSGQIRCCFACSSCHHARHSPSILTQRENLLYCVSLHACVCEVCMYVCLCA